MGPTRGLLLIAALLRAPHVRSFAPTARGGRRRNGLLASSSSANPLAQELLTALERESDDATTLALVRRLEASYESPSEEDDPRRFQPLLGLYNVTRTISLRSGDTNNPVGGKWTRRHGGRLRRWLLEPAGAWQHLLPPNSTGLACAVEASATTATTAAPAVVVAEAVNHVRLRALGGRWMVHVLLRGDAATLSPGQRRRLESAATTAGGGAADRPLSPLTARVAFDAPLIYVEGGRGRRRWRHGIRLGPRTSVVLDTTYGGDADDGLRIGRGGSSGTRFLFRRTDAAEARDYARLLPVRPVARPQALAMLAITALAGRLMMMRMGVLRFVGGLLTGLSVLCGGLLALSGGGIERDDDDRRRRGKDAPLVVVAAAAAGPVHTSAPESGDPSTSVRDDTDPPVPPPLDDAALRARYAAIGRVEDRAYQILVDLGLAQGDPQL